MISKEDLKMPAKSKAQQRFFGMVRAAQKGDLKNPSSEVADVADDISVKDAKKFAKTKHKGLPEVKEEKKGRHPRDQKELDRAQAFIKKNPNFGKKEVKEEASYRDFVKNAQAASERVKKAKQARKDANAKAAYKDKVTKGVKFYDKKGKGHIRDGKKVYS